MKNMKIEINDAQPLGDVVAELERLGYKETLWDYSITTIWIVATDDGWFMNMDYSTRDITYKLTTLAELKEMK